MESFEGLLKTIGNHSKRLQFMQKTTAFGHMLPQKKWARIPRQLKVPFIMKVSIGAIMSILLSAQLLIAGDGFAQSSSETQITLELHDASLRNALNKIEKLSGYKMAYILQQVAKYKNINLQKDTRSHDRVGHHNPAGLGPGLQRSIQRLAGFYRRFLEKRFLQRQLRRHRYVRVLEICFHVLVCEQS